MDVSVTKNYAECFSISEQKDGLRYTEVAHNGKEHSSMMRCSGEWMVATLETRSVQLKLQGGHHVIFRYKPNGSESWTESEAGRVPEITNLGVPTQRVITSKQMIAILFMMLLAMMDGLFFLLCSPGSLGRFYRDDDRWYPVPTAVGECPMPPPQPFYLEAGGAVVRTFVTSTVLSIQSVQSWADEFPRQESRLDFIKYHGARVYLMYQIAILPASLGLVWYTSRNHSGDDACLAAMFTNSPYILNALASIAQYTVGQQYIRRMETWARGAKHRVPRWQSGKGGGMEEKQRYLRILASLNALLVGLPTLAILATYIVPAFKQPLFLIQFVVLLLSGGIISWLVGAGEFLKHATGKSARGEYLKRVQYCTMRYVVSTKYDPYANSSDIRHAQAVNQHHAEALEREATAARSQWTYAVFYFMPMFVSFRVALEVAFFEIMHTRAGLTPWEATQVTWSERRIDVFAVSLLVATRATLWHCWSGSQFLMEWL